MTGQELYDEGCQHLRCALEATPYTHIHSEDIRANVFANYILPAAKQDCLPAIKDVVDYYMGRKEYHEASQWIMRYKEIAKCGKMELLKVFGARILRSLM